MESSLCADLKLGDAESTDHRCTAKTTLASLNDPLALNILTPPSSEESTMAPPRSKSETPLSHHTPSGISLLPRDFKRKCSLNVYCDESATCHLVSIEEESVIVGTNKNAQNERGSPKKKLKSCVKNLVTSVDILGQELKENSPIKVDLSSGGCSNGWFTNKAVQPNAWFIKPPPYIFNALCPPNEETCQDILTNLGRKNMFNVIQKIISYLDPIDLTRVASVSHSWRSMTIEVASRRELARARKLALRSKENIDARPSQVVKSRNETTPKKVVSFVVNNCIPSPKRRGPQSPELSPGSKRFCYYVREGQALGRAGRLQKCPKCRCPARLRDLTATCSQCHYTFCAQCRFPPHPTKQCSFVIASPSSPSPRKPAKGYSVGSQASKKALRRL